MEVQYNEAALQEITDKLASLSDALRKVSSEARGLVEMIASGQPRSVADEWVALHGEAATRKAVAKLLNISPTTVAKLIEDGELELTPNDRVLIRSCAAWANKAVHSAGRPARKAKLAKAFIP